MSSLTPKQEAFVAEYLVDLNGAAAAVRAGYSASTANRIASELLSKANIAAAIDTAKKVRSERTGVDAEYVLARLVAEAEADLADLYDEGTGNLKPVEEWPLIWRQGLVSSVETEETTIEGKKVGHVKKIRLSDRIRRIELIGKHVRVNAFQDVVEFKGLEGLADRLERATARKTGRLGTIDAEFEALPEGISPAPEPAPTPMPVKTSVIPSPHEPACAPAPSKPDYLPIMPAVASPPYSGRVGRLPDARPFLTDVASVETDDDPLTR